MYCIQNLINGKRYVGSAAKSFYIRWVNHRNRLIANTHHNVRLQRAWNKYGRDAFVFSILETCEPRFCVAIEQTFIDCFRSCDSRYGYNLAPIAGSTLGVKYSEESRAKLSAMRQNVSLETRQKISAAKKGVKKSPEAVEKGAAKLRGRKMSKEFSEKLSARNRGRTVSQETRDKIRETSRKRKPSPESIAKAKATKEARGISDAVRLKLSLATRGKKQSPEHVAKKVASRKLTMASRKQQTPV